MLYFVPVRCAGLAALLVAAFSLGSCFPGEVDFASRNTKIKVSRVRIPESRAQRTYFAMSASVDDARDFVRPPYDLWGSFVVETTYGVFDAGKFEASAEAAVVLELDARGPSPFEFYGIGAQVFVSPLRGLNVYVQSAQGNHGAMFFAGAERIDVRISSSGPALVFEARVADTGNFQQIDSINRTTPAAPLNAGMGYFNLDRGGELGYEFLRVPQNGAPPVPQGAQYDALQSYYASLFSLQSAASQLNVAMPYASLAEGDLLEALGQLADARGLITGLDSGTSTDGKGVDVRSALKHVDKVTKITEKLLDAVQRAEGSLSRSASAAKKVTKTVASKLFKPSYELTDLIITPELRASLPGDL